MAHSLPCSPNLVLGSTHTLCACVHVSLHVCAQQIITLMRTAKIVVLAAMLTASNAAFAPIDGDRALTFGNSTSSTGTTTGTTTTGKQCSMLDS